MSRKHQTQTWKMYDHRCMDGLGKFPLQTACPTSGVHDVLAKELNCFKSPGN